MPFPIANNTACDGVTIVDVSILMVRSLSWSDIIDAQDTPLKSLRQLCLVCQSWLCLYQCIYMGKFKPEIISPKTFPRSGSNPAVERVNHSTTSAMIIMTCDQTRQYESSGASLIQIIQLNGHMLGIQFPFLDIKSHTYPEIELSGQ